MVVEKRRKNYVVVYDNYEVISKLVKKYNKILISGDEPQFRACFKDFPKIKIPSIIVYLVDYADEEGIFYNNFPTKKLSLICLHQNTSLNLKMTIV